MEKEGKTKSLAQIAADDIIKLIKDNNMEPGQRLENEYELAKRLNVGRGTIREAIRSLVSRNMLEEGLELLSHIRMVFQRIR